MNTVTVTLVEGEVALVLDLIFMLGYALVLGIAIGIPIYHILIGKQP